MLQVLKVKSTKAFSDEGILRLAPLTVITGKNSSGKSTLFHALLLIKQAYVRSPRLFAGLNLNGSFVSIGTYDDWSSGRSGKPANLSLTVGGHTAGDNSGANSQTSPIKWWQPRATGPNSSATVQATLELTLSRAPEEATSAHLESLVFHSEINGNDGRRGAYTLRLAQRPRSEFQSPSLFPYDDAALQYHLSAKLALDPEVESDEDETLPSKAIKLNSDGVSAVEGLVPARIFAETDNDAAPRTLGRAVRVAVDAVVTHLEEQVGAYPGSRWKPEKYVFEWDVTDAKLENVIHFVNECSVGAFVRYCKLSPTLSARLLLGSAERVQEVNWRRLADAFYDRLNLVAFSSVEASEKPKDQLSISCAQIVAKHPQLAKPCAFLMQFHGSAFLDSPAATLFGSLIIRAASEASGSKKWLRLARNVLDTFKMRNTSSSSISTVPMYSRSAVPTELNIQTYFEDYLFHLGPLRDEPRNLYSTEPPNQMVDVGRKGERAIECLRRFGNESVSVPVPSVTGLQVVRLIDAVTLWARRLELLEGLTIDNQSKYGTVCQVNTGSGKETVYADLNNVGVGVSQLLPVIVLCLAAPVGSTILIEQPELHLHPAVQVRLAELFVACAKTGRQIVVETHSEHLMNGIRLEVSRKNMSPQELSIAAVLRDEFGAEIKPITIEPDGSISNWPAGFFDESARILLQLLEKRIGQ
jgi:predicted ATPase